MRKWEWERERERDRESARSREFNAAQRREHSSAPGAHKIRNVGGGPEKTPIVFVFRLSRARAVVRIHDNNIILQVPTRPRLYTLSTTLLLNGYFISPEFFFFIPPRKEQERTRAALFPSCERVCVFFDRFIISLLFFKQILRCGVTAAVAVRAEGKQSPRFGSLDGINT